MQHGGVSLVTLPRILLFLFTGRDALQRCDSKWCCTASVGLLWPRGGASCRRGGAPSLIVRVKVHLFVCACLVCSVISVSGARFIGGVRLGWRQGETAGAFLLAAVRAACYSEACLSLPCPRRRVQCVPAELPEKECLIWRVERTGPAGLTVCGRASNSGAFVFAHVDNTVDAAQRVKAAPKAALWFPPFGFGEVDHRLMGPTWTPAPSELLFLLVLLSPLISRVALQPQTSVWPVQDLVFAEPHIRRPLSPLPPFPFAHPTAAMLAAQALERRRARSRRAVKAMPPKTVHFCVRSLVLRACGCLRH